MRCWDNGSIHYRQEHFREEAMKVFIPLCDEHLHLLGKDDRLVPWKVEYTLLSELGEELFTEADPRPQNPASESSGPRPELPAGQPGQR